MDAASDDLLRPVGPRPRKPAKTGMRLPAAPILAALLASAGLSLSTYVALVDDPLGGQPHAFAPITARAEAEPAPSAGGGSLVREVPPGGGLRTATETEGAAGVSVTRGDGQGAPSSVFIQVEPEAPRLAPAPDPRLVERHRHGSLPKVAPDGAKPLQVYARPEGSLPGRAQPAGRIAIVLTGLGISPSLTVEAVAKLPPPVTLAFAPYGQGLEAAVAKAREAGHEVMLQVPMEPFDYPDNDPGPHTLTTSAKAEANLDRLHWTMARFPGFTGLVNFMGARLTASEASLAPILREVGARGLGFLDDGSSSRSLVQAVGASTGAPTARADVVLDASPRPDAFDKELARLEELARGRGLAVGTAAAMPQVVERLARWSKTLEARGILLVPASRAFHGGPSQGAPRPGTDRR